MATAHKKVERREKNIFNMGTKYKKNIKIHQQAEFERRKNIFSSLRSVSTHVLRAHTSATGIATLHNTHAARPCVAINGEQSEEKTRQRRGGGGVEEP
jgi:hypothetical protein